MQVIKIISSIGNIFTFFIVVLTVNACTKKMVFEQYKNIEDSAWHKDSIVNFQINLLDTLSKNNVYVSLRNDKDYEFSNLFLIVGIKFPNNYHIVDTLEYEMTTSEGNFLGTGMSDVKENKLEYKTQVTFPIQGEYNVHIQHAMRKTRNVDGLIFLNGIADVGLQIEKVD